MDEQSTSTVEAETLHNGTTGSDHPDGEAQTSLTGNGHSKVLQRMETVPDIKRDTSGITTQYIATGIGKKPSLGFIIVTSERIFQF